MGEAGAGSGKPGAAHPLGRSFETAGGHRIDILALAIDAAAADEADAGKGAGSVAE